MCCHFAPSNRSTDVLKQLIIRLYSLAVKHLIKREENVNKAAHIEHVLYFNCPFPDDLTLQSSSVDWFLSV